MPVFADQMGNQIKLDAPPRRIISLVPSQSELLWDLGLGQQLVGITKFCVHPEKMFRSVQRVGGTKKLDLGLIRSLNPDLIIGNKEENSKAEIHDLSRDFNVWMSDVNTIGDALQMITDLALVTGKEKEGALLRQEIDASLSACKDIFKGLSAAYLMWRDPIMVAAGNTFINAVLVHAGFANVFSGEFRYPVVDAERIKSMNPSVCLLSSEPFPFGEKDRLELAKVLPGVKILLADGEMLSWYGSRLRLLGSYFSEMKELLAEFP